MPAFEGAPLYQHDSEQAVDTSGKTSSPPEREVPEEAGENGIPHKDQSAEEEQQTFTAPPTPKPFPVVVFSHGLAAMRTIYCGICSDLASKGSVVVAVEHRCVIVRLPIEDPVYRIYTFTYFYLYFDLMHL